MTKDETPQPYSLSDADFKAALAVAWKAGASLSTRMDAAYNLGIQRGKEEARVALAAPVVTPDEWVEGAMELVTHISELYVQTRRYGSEALHSAWAAKRAELASYLRARPAVPDIDAVFFMQLRDWHLAAIKEQKHVD